MTKYKDIMESWKNSKFVMVDYMNDYCTVILTDVNYWFDQWDELDEWSKEHNCEVQGMTVTVPNEKIKMLFVLRWS